MPFFATESNRNHFAWNDQRSVGHGGLYEGGFSKTGGGMVGAAGGLRATRQPQLFPVTGQ
jgi:hypothetical protein